jgi:hypothetical protein
MRAGHDHSNTSLARPSAWFVHPFSGRMAAGLLIAGVALLPTFVGGAARIPAASAAEAKVDLGTATPFSVLAGAGVTNTGPSVLGGDLGTCPTPAITGFPPGVANGTTHANDAVACQAQSDLTIAYDSAAGRAPTTTYSGPTDLGGLTLTTGVYKSPVSFATTGTLTLNAEGNPDAVFIFQAGSTLITATDSAVRLVNGAQACNVFWQVGSSSTLGVDSTFAGTVIALTSITANHKATVDGRLLARNGAVTLDANKVSAAACATGDSSSSSSATTATTGPDEDSSSTSATTGPDEDSSSTTATSSSSTSSSATSSSSSSSSTTLPLLSGSSSSTTTTAEGSTTTTAPGDSASTTRSGSGLSGATDSSAPAAATDVRGGSVNGTDLNGSASTATLPRTGSSIGIPLMLGVLALLLGAAALRFGRQDAPKQP